ncbi:MAG: hypothetical protein LUE27_10045 [Clostridia bacterium]|nr:hypothetical protein [Clostridia bacterium]
MKKKDRDKLIHQRGLAVFDYWRNDWCLFVSQVFGATLDSDQEKILRAVQTRQYVSVASGTARGKDFVAACAALCFLYLTPRWRRNQFGNIELAENTKVILTAPTDRQVKKIMMPEISRLYNKAKARGYDLPGELMTYDIKMKNDEWFLTGFKADENNHEAWSGLHAVHIMFIVTEASGISEDTYAAIEGNLQNDSRLLLVFNPNSPVGYAARSQKQERWTRFRLNSLTAPNVINKRVIIPGQVDYNWVIDKLQNWCTPITADEVTSELDDFQFEGQWYRPEDLFRKKVLGKFPKVADDILIPPQWVEEAHRRWQENGRTPVSPSLNVLGVDVAGMGRDATCFVHRRDNWVGGFRVFNSGGQADHVKIAGEITAERRRSMGLYVSIDTIGEGAGVFSMCRENEKERNKDYIVSCKFSEGTRGKYGRELKDTTGQYTFLNMRAYLFWAVRDWLNPKNNTGAMLPPDTKFDEEASEIRWFFRSDGRIQIEPKEDIVKRIDRSPDRFDALANTFYPVKRANAIDLERLSMVIG